VRVLWLADATPVIDHARSTAPHEACGVLLGHPDEPVRQIVTMTNHADDPTHHFHIDPHELADILAAARRDRLELIGFYHSHPKGRPIPSPLDIRRAGEWSVHLIVGLRGPQAEMAAWYIRNGRVKRLQLHLSDKPPNLPPIQTPAQNIAIIAASIIAMIAVLVIAYNLLPPAP
jgi:desampylase